MAIEAAKLFISVGADTRQGEQGLTSVNDKLNKVAANATLQGGILSTAITAPLTMIAKQGLDSAMSYEQSMNMIQFSMQATAAEMDMLGKQAIQLGQDSVFSAAEVAEAQLELAKSGMGVMDTLAAMPGIVALAAAADTNLAYAANITTGALNAFNLEASESARIADLLAAAANASAADITDIANGFQQASFAFDATGQKAEDLAAALAILTNVGLTGSDAGTALKNMMTRLMAPTGEALDVLRQLGIVQGDINAATNALINEVGAIRFDDGSLDLEAMFAKARGFTDSVDKVGGWIPVSVSFREDPKFQKEFQEYMGSFTNNLFFDEFGNMKELPEIIDLINEATKDMSMEQRNAALTTIFLSDGTKALLPLLDIGKDGFLAMKDAVTEEGAAAGMANARMMGLAGAIEEFKGTLDSLLIGQAMPFMDFLANGVRGAANLLTAFTMLSPNVQRATLAFLGVVAAAGPVMVGIGGIAAGLAFLLTPIGRVIAATSLLAAAWAGDFFGIQDLTVRAFNTIANTLAGWWETAQPYVDAARAAFDVLWTGLTGEGDVATVMANLETISGVFGPDFATRISDAALALHGFVTTAKSIDFDDLRSSTAAIATKFVGQVQAKLGLEIDWTQLRVNASEMVTIVGQRLSTVDWSTLAVDAQGMLFRVGSRLNAANWTEMSFTTSGLLTRVAEQLSAVDWSTMAVNFGGFISRAGDELTRQADVMLGEGNIISRTVEKVRGTIGMLQTLGEGASIDEPLDLLKRAVTGAIGIWNLIGSIRADVAIMAITNLQSLLTTALNFATGIVAGVNPELTAKAATGLVTGFTDQIIALTQPDQLGDLGTAAGALTKEFITQLGNVLGSEGFGEDVGSAVGKGTAAFLTGALALAAGIANELETIPFDTLIPSIQNFTNKFIASAADEIAKGDYAPLARSILTGIGTALVNLLQANPFSLFNMGEEIRQRQKEAIEQGTWQPDPRVQDAILSPSSEPTWADVGKAIADGFNQAMENSSAVMRRYTPGPDPILSQHVDLLEQQRERERAAELGAVFGEAGQGAFLFDFNWPTLDSILENFKWPEIPVPQWWSDLMEWSGLAQSSAATALDLRDEMLEIAARIRNSGGGGGNDGDGVGGDNPGFDPDQPNIEFPTAAVAGAGEPNVVIQFNAPISIADAIDLEQFKLEIIAAVRRGMR